MELSTFAAAGAGMNSVIRSGSGTVRRRWSFFEAVRRLDVAILIGGRSSAHEFHDRVPVEVGEFDQYVQRELGRVWRVVVFSSVGLAFGVDAIPPAPKCIQSPWRLGGEAKECRLFRAEAVAESAKPLLLDVCLAVEHDQVNEGTEHVVVQILQSRRQGRAVPDRFIETRKLLEDPRDFGSARRRPASWPVRARLPELENCGAGLGGTIVRVRITGSACVISTFEQPRRVVCEPSNERVVRIAITEFSEDSLAELGGGVSRR